MTPKTSPMPTAISAKIGAERRSRRPALRSSASRTAERHARGTPRPCARCRRVVGGQRQPQLAVREHVRPVGERDRALRALLDEQDADARARGSSRASRRRGRRSSARDRATARRGAGRRARDDRARDRELLLLAAGERARVPVAELLDDREQLVDLGDVLVDAVALAAAGETEPEVLLDRELGEEPSPLGNERDPAPRDVLRGAPRSDRSPRRMSPPRAGTSPMIACSVVDLPGAVRADEPDDLAGRDLEREAADGGDAAVARPRDRDSSTSVRSRSSARRSRRGRRRRRRGCRGSRRRALGERPALVEHLDAVADVHDQRHVVIDQEHARVVLVAHRAHDVGEGRHLRLGEARRGLVHEHEAGLGRERPGDAEAALVAVRERAGRRVRVGRSSSDSSSPSARRRASRGPAPTPSAATSTFSRTESPRNERLCWKVRASPSPAPAVRRSSA